MSAICHGFVQNAWRKDICSNCFRLRDEHPGGGLGQSQKEGGGDIGRYSLLSQRHHSISSDNLHRDKMNGSSNNHNNHAISILVKNSERIQKMGRYQSPTSGIPRAHNPHLKYGSSPSNGTNNNNNNNSNNSNTNTHTKPFCSTFNADNFNKTGKFSNHHHNNPLANLPESLPTESPKNGLNGSSNKMVTHPVAKADSVPTHMSSSSSPQVQKERLVNSVNGSPEASSSSFPDTPLGTVQGGVLNSSVSSNKHFQIGKSNANPQFKSNGQSQLDGKHSAVLSAQGLNHGHSSSDSDNPPSLPSSSSQSSPPSSNNSSPRIEITTKKKTASLRPNFGSHHKECVTTPTERKYVKHADRLLSKSTSNIMDHNLIDSSLSRGTSGKHGGSKSKGILKASEREKRRKLSVKFNKEVCEVIGYGGNSSSEVEDELEDVDDPQDMASISELLANNANTSEEKELHQLTIKNTNFNSIKTNLLGYAPIQIGPIVGCTNGKSMESGSKPLVCIGTFESRKEPLRIKRINDVEVEVKEETRNNKDVPTTKARGEGGVREAVATKLSGILKNGFSTSSSEQSSSSDNNSTVKAKQRRVPPSSDNVVAVVNLSVNTANTNVVSGNKSPVVPNGNYLHANGAGGGGGGTGNTSNDIRINGKEIISKSEDSVSTIQVNPEKSCIKVTATIPLKTSSSSSSAPQSGCDDEAAEGMTPPTSSAPPEKLPLNQSEDEPSTTAFPLRGGSNNGGGGRRKAEPPAHLIVLNGETNNNIANKRTSFLNEIIEPVGTVNYSTKSHPQTIPKSPGSDNNYGEEPTSMYLDKDSLDGTVLHSSNNLKVLNSNTGNNIHSSHHLLKVNHLRAFEIDDHEYDDSLEDSGLDIGKSKATVENSSESDDNDMEKFGSSSDSGNENDFVHDRIIMNVPQNDLYISVDEEKTSEIVATIDKPKLSPDSVLFSSTSENSNSGSEESIPECVNVHVSTASAGIPPASVKRQAPLPPTAAPEPSDVAEDIVIPEVDIIADEEAEEEHNDIYDDVSSYQLERQLQQQLQLQHDQEYQDEVEEESIYDDCNAISASNGKSVCGSYDFTDRSGLSADSGPDSAERIPLRPSDGIEFIGIRKIDSETHLNAAIANESNQAQRSFSSEGTSSSKKERSSSVSPKARRKVNQFFSTLGKKAGAAFSSSHGPLSGTAAFLRSKSPSPAPIATVTEYKRSLSQDEVSMTRTQEIYATLTPASLKFKGLAPVLQKLSRMDTSSSHSSTDDSSPKEKMFKKNKILPSIKKLLRVGNKDRDNEYNVSSYEFKTETKSSSSRGGDMSSSSSSTNMSSSETYSHSSLHDTNSLGRGQVIASSVSKHGTVRAAPPIGRPPPPPPRVHSLDLLNRVGTVGANSGMGSVKPARPPPPVRSNKIAPSFVSVFATQEDGLFGGEAGPPSKPKRKASMNGHSPATTVLRSDDEPSLDNNATSLNFETLRLIAGQIPAKIKSKSSRLADCGRTPIRWSHFYLSDFEPMADGDYFAFYSALWEQEPCVLLIEDAASNAAFVNLASVEVAASFVDNIPIDLIPWNPTDYHSGCHDIKVNVSVLPSCTVKKMSSYINSRSFSTMQKCFALLQSLDYWGKEDMSDLLVFQGGCKDQETPADSELIYVVPVNSPKTLHRSYTYLSNNFEITIKQFLLQPHVLTGDDRQVLYRMISGTPQEVELQIKLFLQVKLFGSRLKSEEMDKIRTTKSERIIHQWIERERALCMKEAIERTIKRDNEPISPLKKTFVEFLMNPDISAKMLLDLIVDICN